jgi:hypothetical protein
MELYVGTAINPLEVVVFFADRPSLDAWRQGSAGGYWSMSELDYAMYMLREDVVGECPFLPTHGTKELLEYEIGGNGRLVEWA